MNNDNIQDFFSELENMGYDVTLFNSGISSNLRLDFVNRSGRGWIYKNSSQDMFELEIDSIFMNSWLFVGLSTEIPRSGDYFTWNAFGKSFIIIRGQNEKIHCYLNVCPHRGSSFNLQSYGNLKDGKIECPYHGWQFALSGQLLNCRNANFERSLPHLQEIQTDIFLENLIFINPKNEHALPTISQKYSWMNEDLKPFHIEKMKYIDPVTSDYSRTKWLVILENNQESYHAIIHKEYLELFRGGIAGDHFYSFGPQREDLSSATVKEYLAMTTKFPTYFPYLPGKNLSGWSFYYLYPNTGITVTPHEIQIDQILPVDKESSEIRSYRFGIEIDCEFIQKLRLLSHKIDENVKKEDLELFPQIQLGLNTSSNDHVFILTPQEKGVGGLLNYLFRLAPVMGLKLPPRGHQIRDLNIDLLRSFSAHPNLRANSFTARNGQNSEPTLNSTT